MPAPTDAVPDRRPPRPGPPRRTPQRCWRDAVRWRRCCAAVAVVAGAARGAARRRADGRGDGGRPRPRLRHGLSAATTWSCAATRPARAPAGSDPDAVGPHAGRAGARGRAGDRRPAGRAVAGRRLPRPGRAPGADRRRGRRGAAAGRATASTWWRPTRAAAPRRTSRSTCRSSPCRAPADHDSRRSRR